jgi:putative endonuclease
MSGQLHDLRSERGRKGRRDGRRGEWIAALLLMCKGYQILGFRLRTKHGEIDILAKRGRTLALVEVKRRPTIEQALGALGAIQRERLLRAGRNLVDHRPSLRQLTLRVQLIALAPKRFPRHVSNIFFGHDQ